MQATLRGRLVAVQDDRYTGRDGQPKTWRNVFLAESMSTEPRRLSVDEQLPGSLDALHALKAVGWCDEVTVTVEVREYGKSGVGFVLAGVVVAEDARV
jgi:hypothetical protein